MIVGVATGPVDEFAVREDNDPSLRRAELANFLLRVAHRVSHGATDA